MEQYVWQNTDRLYVQFLEKGLLVDSYSYPLSPTYKGYEVCAIQNASKWVADIPTVRISCQESGWDEALARWLKGQNPTDSKEWKKGVIALTAPKVEVSYVYFALDGKTIRGGLHDKYVDAKKRQLQLKRKYPKISLGKVQKDKLSESINAANLVFEASVVEKSKPKSTTFNDLELKYKNKIKQMSAKSSRSLADPRFSWERKAESQTQAKLTGGQQVWDGMKHLMGWYFIKDWFNSAFVLNPDEPKKVKIGQIGQQDSSVWPIMFIYFAFVIGLIAFMVNMK